MLGEAADTLDLVAASDGTRSVPSTGVASLLLTSSVAGAAATALLDTLALGGLSAAEVLSLLREQIALTGSVSALRAMETELMDEARFATSLAVAWQVLLAEGIDTAGAAAGQVLKLAAIVDAMAAVGAADSRLDARAAVSAALAINGLLATGWTMEALDSIAFQDALAGALTAVTRLVDGSMLTATAAPSLALSALVAEEVALEADSATSLEAFAALSEQVLFYATLRLGDGEYAGWVLNGGAPSEYRNFPFNGFVRFADAHGRARYFGTSDSGLYLLEGADDDGAPIEGWVKTFLMDLGTGKQKRLPEVYVAFRGGDRLLLKVVATQRDGTQIEHWYEARVQPGAALHQARVPIGRGLKSVYWQLELRNVAGQPMDVDRLDLRPLILDRRL